MSYKIQNGKLVKSGRRTFRALLIDAEAKSVTEFNVPSDDEQVAATVDEMLGCDGTDGVTVDEHHMLLVDGEGLCKEEDELEARGPAVKSYFQILTRHGLTDPMLGKGVVLGFGPEGETCSVRMTAEELCERTKFVRKRFLGMASGKPDSGPYDFVVAPMFGDAE
jgi:hypothetical protein